MKHKLQLLVTFVLLLFLSNTNETFAQGVDLNATVDQMPPFTIGQTFNYSIESAGAAYYGVRIKLTYDPSIIQLNSLTPVYAFDFTPVNDTSTPGLVKYEAADLGSPITADEIIFNIEFEVLDNTQTITIAHDYDPVDGTVVVNNSGNDILDVANDIVLETLSIESDVFGDNFIVYPNPVSETLSIEIGNLSTSDINDIVIYSIDGRIIKNVKVGNVNETINVDVAQFTNALYFMNISSKEGSSVTYKFVVKH